MQRIVEPERLDTLAAEDPLAVGSRGDLRRLNLLMGNAGFLARGFWGQQNTRPLPSRSLRVVELGGGDGTLLLRLARRWARLGVRAEVTLIDRQNLVSPKTLHAFAGLSWPVQVVVSEVFEWLETPAPDSDVMVANLFLHHFQDRSLQSLFRLAALRTHLFLACEPQRSTLALATAHGLVLLGCNTVTRHDAVVSVRAGFKGQELSALWPTSKDWELSEHSAGLFSHCFSAKRHV